jgi:hypothetical protein
MRTANSDSRAEDGDESKVQIINGLRWKRKPLSWKTGGCGDPQADPSSHTNQVVNKKWE